MQLSWVQKVGLVVLMGAGVSAQGMARSKKIVGGVVAGGALLAAGAIASYNSDAKGVPGGEDAIQHAIVHKRGEHYHSIKTFHDDLGSKTSEELTGIMAELSSDLHIGALEREDKVMLVHYAQLLKAAENKGAAKEEKARAELQARYELALNRPDKDFRKSAIDYIHGIANIMRRYL